jgi:hypothetical protein
VHGALMMARERDQAQPGQGRRKGTAADHWRSSRVASIDGVVYPR